MTSPPLVVVAHGTADPAGAAVVDDLVGLVRAWRPGLAVSAAYVQHTSPSVGAALAAAAGPVAVVLPLLLFPATHSKGDIPAAIQRERSRRPGLDVRYGRPLGADALLVSALHDRLVAAGAGPEHAVVLAAAGAADPEANAQVAATARLLWEWRSGGAGRGADAAPVEAGFAAASRPTVAEAARRLSRLGHRDIAVSPAFLAPGHFVRASAEAARSVHPSAVVADVIGAHEDVARLLLARYDEALGAEVRMNCDSCLFRTPWPGREHRVGEPQVVHDHPDE